MSRRKSKSSASNFGRLFRGTVLLSIVFGLGLIVGQRLLEKQSMPPLVSVMGATPALSSAARSKVGPEDPSTSAKDTSHTAKPVFSFYDQLSRPAPKKPAAELRPKTPLIQKRSEVVESVPKKAEPQPEPQAKPQPEPQPEAVVAEKVPEATSEVPEEIEPVVADEAPVNVQEEPEVVAAPAQAQEEPEVVAKPTALPARYTLQVASHPTLDRARHDAQRLEKLGMEPHLVTAEVPGQGKLYRVRVGKFHSLDEARNFQGVIKARNSLDTFVTPL